MYTYHKNRFLFLDIIIRIGNIDAEFCGAFIFGIINKFRDGSECPHMAGAKRVEEAVCTIEW